MAEMQRTSSGQVPVWLLLTVVPLAPASLWFFFFHVDGPWRGVVGLSAVIVTIVSLRILLGLFDWVAYVRWLNGAENLAEMVASLCVDDEELDLFQVGRYLAISRPSGGEMNAPNMLAHVAVHDTRRLVPFHLEVKLFGEGGEVEHSVQTFRSVFRSETSMVDDNSMTTLTSDGVFVEKWED